MRSGRVSRSGITGKRRSIHEPEGSRETKIVPLMPVQGPGAAVGRGIAPVFAVPLSSFTRVCVYLQ
jgi:hypothetical protein